MVEILEEKTTAPMTAAGQSLFHRRIEFHPARRPYTGVPHSSGDFHLEILNPDGLDDRRAASGSCFGLCASETSAHRRRSTGGEFHEHGLDPELSFRISFQRIGAGLENLGNTCYLNSVLQCLTYTEPFAAYLQSGKHKSTCRAAGFCAMCALQSHVMDALRSSGKILRPFHLVKNLRCISRSFRNSRQEDAHEYMVNLLESMHKCCLPSGVSSESPSSYENSLVHKIFGGLLRSQVKCMQCSYCSNKFDPFLDLSLEIIRADSLRKALAHFTATEQLDGGERQYQCQRCKEKVRALKQLTIHKAPYVLTVHLKRFGSSIREEKINKKVEFGPMLDLKPFVSGLHEGELKYTLYGVLVHAGWSTHSGHYFCYVRTSTGMWYSLDDNHVSQVSEKTVLSREAYMLFYVRDRSSAIKRPVEINLNSDISANSTGNKGIPLVERKLNTLLYSSVKTSHEVIIHGLPVYVDSPRQHLFNNQELFVENIGLQASDGLHRTKSANDETELVVSVNSKLPSVHTKKGNAIYASVEGTATQQKMETSCTTDGDDDKKALNTAVTYTHQTEVKPKIHFVAEGSYFGRRQLFLMSVGLVKRMKKKTEKLHQHSRNKRMIETVDVGSMPSSFKNDEDKEMPHSCSVSLLKESLREATVAKWDDVEEVLTSQINELEDAPKRTIGYLLDEWDEEYDRGKRKKLKSRQWFDEGLNPFQKTADLKTHHLMMKVAQTSLGK